MLWWLLPSSPPDTRRAYLVFYEDWTMDTLILTDDEREEVWLDESVVEVWLVGDQDFVVDGEALA